MRKIVLSCVLLILAIVVVACKNVNHIKNNEAEPSTEITTLETTSKKLIVDTTINSLKLEVCYLSRKSIGVRVKNNIESFEKVILEDFPYFIDSLVFEETKNHPPIFVYDLEDKIKKVNHIFIEPNVVAFPLWNEDAPLYLYPIFLKKNTVGTLGKKGLIGGGGTGFIVYIEKLNYFVTIKRYFGPQEENKEIVLQLEYLDDNHSTLKSKVLAIKKENFAVYEIPEGSNLEEARKILIRNIYHHLTNHIDK